MILETKLDYEKQPPLRNQHSKNCRYWRGSQQFRKGRSYSWCMWLFLWYILTCKSAQSHSASRVTLRALRQTPNLVFPVLRWVVVKYFLKLLWKNTCIHMYITFKRIELESLCWSGFEALQICFKTWATEAFQLNSFRSYVYVNTTVVIRS